jgi:hypothetical protein
MRTTKKVVLLAALVGCSKTDTQFAAVFDTPQQSTTSSSLLGTWGGSFYMLEQRWVLRQDRFTITQRCGSEVIGINVAATITPSKIQVHEAKRAGSGSCSVESTVTTMNACTPAYDDTPCFVHMGNKLRLHISKHEHFDLTKFAD